MNIAALIVTYGNRYDLCIQVIRSCLSQDIKQIILVCNNPDISSLEKFKLLPKNLSNIIHIVESDKNLGSAGGFNLAIKKGLEFTEISNFLLLDDDNLLLNGSIDSLILSRKLLSKSYIDPVLYCFRSSWSGDINCVKNGVIKDYGYNNFCGFNFFSILNTRFFSLFKNEFNYLLLRVNVGPYGGMFISRDVLNIIGYPDKNLFLYADDVEYSLRFKKFNIQQFMTYFAEIKDIDEMSPTSYGLFSSNYSELKLYYSIRNHTFISSTLINNMLVYIINKYIFYLKIHLKFLCAFFINSSDSIIRLKLIKKAIKDSKNLKYN